MTVWAVCKDDGTECVVNKDKPYLDVLLVVLGLLIAVHIWMVYDFIRDPRPFWDKFCPGCPCRPRPRAQSPQELEVVPWVESASQVLIVE